MRCSARSFSSARRSFSSRRSSSASAPAPAGAGDRVRGGHPVPHRDQRLRAGPDDVERPVRRRRRAAAGTCTGSGWWPAAPGRRRARRRRCRISNRWETTTWNASPARICSFAASTAAWCGRGRPAAHLRVAPGQRVVRRDRRRGRRGQLGGHPVEAGHRVVVGVVDALVAGVPVHRVRDQGDRALVVVERGEVGGQQHHQLGDVQVVVGELGQPLQAAHRVVAEVADQPAGQRRQAGQRLGAQLLEACRAGPAAGRRRPAGPPAASPVQCACPSRAVSAAALRAPTNDQRDHDPPFSADSSRNVPRGGPRACGRARRGSRRRRAGAGSPGSPGGGRRARGNARGSARPRRGRPAGWSRTRHPLWTPPPTVSGGGLQRRGLGAGAGREGDRDDDHAAADELPRGGELARGRPSRAAPRRPAAAAGSRPRSTRAARPCRRRSAPSRCTARPPRAAPARRSPSSPG